MPPTQYARVMRITTSREQLLSSPRARYTRRLCLQFGNIFLLTALSNQPTPGLVSSFLSPVPTCRIIKFIYSNFTFLLENSFLVYIDCGSKQKFALGKIKAIAVA